MREDPIDRVEWVRTGDLLANDYNPNMVMAPELRLLRTTMLSFGWLQPLLVHDPSSEIIDGFHRWMLSKEDRTLRERYSGRVPVVRLKITNAERKILTVAINRAKGTHQALRMHELVRSLIDVDGLTAQQVATGIGARPSEVELLYKEGVFEARGLDAYRYSKAWEPDDQ